MEVSSSNDIIYDFAIADNNTAVWQLEKEIDVSGCCDRQEMCVAWRHPPICPPGLLSLSIVD